MPVCDDDESKRTCPKEMENMNALEACKAVEAKKKSILDSMGSALENLNPLTAIGNAFGSKNESVSNFITETQINVNQTQLSEALAGCDQQVNMVQSNLVDSTACDAQFAAERAKLDEYYNQALLRGDDKAAKSIAEAKNKLMELMTRDVGPIDQTNDAELTMKCKANALLSVLAKADTSIANTAMMDLIQKASGPMTSNTSNTNVCNKTTVNQSACQYVSNKSCCMAKFESSQSNVMKGCPRSGQQTNRLIANMECDVGSTSEVTAESGVDASNKTTVKIDQSAETFTSMMSGSSTCCLCVCILVGVVLAWYWYSSQTSGDDPSSGDTFGDDPSSGDAKASIPDAPMSGMPLDLNQGSFVRSLQPGRSSFSKRRR